MSAHAPSDTRALVAIDLGAESCRVSLLRWLSGAPAIFLVHRFLNAPRETNDGLRWDLRMIEAGVAEGLRKAAELAHEGIRSVAVDGWAVDYVRLDAQGHAVADPFCYRDERTVASEKALHSVLSADRMREITGVGILRINTIYQQCADTQEWKKLRWLNLPEYILFRLGGRPVAEFTNASHTQMVDRHTGSWSSEIAAAAHLDLAVFPHLIAPGAVAGRLTGSLSKLPAYANTVLIAPATHDTASAVAGIPAHGEDWAYISSGTWSLVGTVLEAPCDHPEARADNFTNLAAAGGLTCFHKNIHGMWLLRQSMDFWEAMGSVWTVAELIAAAEKLPAPGVLLNIDDPQLLSGGNMPLRMQTQLAARGLAIDPQDEPAVANLIFHSLAGSYAEVLSRIARHTGKCLRRLFIVGGGSRNLYLNRLTAQATGLEVLRGSQESSTIGNLAIQLAALAPDPPVTPAAVEISAWAAMLQNSYQEAQDCVP